MYLRYQSTQPNRRGVYPGVFALANGLAQAGSLSPVDRVWWRNANDWCNDAYADPCSIDGTVYDQGLNPGAQAWFKSSAHHLLEKVDEYLDLLRRYGVPCERMQSNDPGRIVYEDEVQIVVAPH